MSMSYCCIWIIIVYRCMLYYMECLYQYPQAHWCSLVLHETDSHSNPVLLMKWGDFLVTIDLVPCGPICQFLNKGFSDLSDVDINALANLTCFLWCHVWPTSISYNVLKGLWAYFSWSRQVRNLEAAPLLLLTMFAYSQILCPLCLPRLSFC